MKVTGIALVVLGLAIGTFAGVGYMLTDPAARAFPTVMAVATAGAVLAGAAALAFGGRGYTESQNPSVHN